MTHTDTKMMSTTAWIDGHPTRFTGFNHHAKAVAFLEANAQEAPVVIELPMPSDDE